jgi:hypothetical protein
VVRRSSVGLGRMKEENEKLEPKGILSNYESQQCKPVSSVCSRMLKSITLNEAS